MVCDQAFMLALRRDAMKVRDSTEASNGSTSDLIAG